jgi:fructose-bisphosphate aldolase, class II
MTLKEALTEAQEAGRALGHFNFSDSTQFNAIIAAAERLGVPVAVGVSEGEGEFLGLSVAAALVSAAKAAGKRVFLNADHSYTAARAKAAIDAGFDSVIIDGAKLPFEENVAMAKEVVAYARASGRDVLVEGELGYIGTSSKVMDELPDGVAITEGDMTKPDEFMRFVEETGVDLMAPAVGNVHGIITSGEPRLSIARVKELAGVSTVPMVLHGGSGTADEDFRDAIKAGIAMVHINTEIRVAYRKGIEASLAKDAKEVAPYRFLAGGFEAVEKAVFERLSLFTNP